MTENVKIYKLTCDDPELIYYGSTKKRLEQRLSHHKCALNCSSRILFDNENVKIHLIEECEVEKRIEREKYYIKNFPCINLRVEGRNKKEYHIDNQEKILEKGRKWREENREWNRQRDRETYAKILIKLRNKENKMLLASVEQLLESGNYLDIENLKNIKNLWKKHLHRSHALGI